MKSGTAVDRVAAAAPFLFVLLWSTGFIGSRFGTAYAEPFTLLAWRYLFTLLLLLVLVLLWRAPWPRTPAQVGHAAMVGMLIHVCYLGGIFWAIRHGMSAGIAALITGLHPLVAAALAGWTLGETVDARRWSGLALGFLGMAMVVGSELGVGAPTLAGVFACLLSVFGIAAGSVWEKRFGAGMPIRSSQTIQYATGCALMFALSFGLETGEVEWNTAFLLTMLWLVGALSIGAMALFHWLNRRGDVSGVASFFFLVPPITALESYLIFGETLSRTAIVGMAVTAVGVAIAMREPPRKQRRNRAT